MDVSQEIGTPCRRRRYWMRVPTRISIRWGVTTRTPSSGGVIASRLRASAKNGNTSAGARPRRSCSRCKMWVRMDLEIRTDDHVRGATGDALVVYADFPCPYCALAHARLS